ncbi:MAG: amidohydrolase family protein [Proteobacteria bacterium]|nr:amidohydrolase family protein [Pseudomonadota bacterium]MDA1064645.1 amidohydrolase family protein [Pseudomonadota bacterium]
MLRLIVIVVSIGLSVTALAASAAPAATAFINVNVITMTDEHIIAGQTVIVENGLITQLGPVDSTPLPEDCLIVDGTDRYLLPGLAEMHGHIPGAASPELGRVLTLLVANGVTTVRGMLGQPSHLALRADLLQGHVFGPRLITSGPSLNGDSVNGAADGAAKVEAQHAAGYDFLKIHPGLDASEFAAIAMAAKKLGMPFAGHVPEAVGLENALAAGFTTIDHLDGYLVAMMPANSDASGGYGGFFDVLLAEQLQQSKITTLAAQTAAAGTWNVPTEALFEHRVTALTAVEMSRRPEMQYMTAATVREWTNAKQRQENERGFNPALGETAIRIRRQLIKALHDAGAGLLLGSDAPQVFNVPGFSLHDELQYLVDAGLSPYAALATGTSAVTRFLGSNTGVIAVGRDADLLLLDANPLENISSTRRIHGVMLRGLWHSSQDLQKRMRPYHANGD